MCVSSCLHSITHVVLIYVVDLDGQVATGVDPSLLVEPEQQRKGYSSFTRVVVTTRPDGVSSHTLDSHITLSRRKCATMVTDTYPVCVLPF